MRKRQSERFLSGGDMEWCRAGEGVRRQVLGYDGDIMMVRVDFEEGGFGTPHTHPNSQVTYVVSGRFEVKINGEIKNLAAGDGFHTAPDELHSVLCLEKGTLLDVFAPYRPDFL